VSRTHDLWERGRSYLASGLSAVSQTVLDHPQGVFPFFAARADGCRITDVDGNTYIDWVMGWGAILLGHAHPTVTRAIKKQIDRGSLSSLIPPVEVEVAERLCAMFPLAERVAFGKNGSDVVTAAVRLARSATGRERVLIHGYHGFHDWFAAAHPTCCGIPGSLRQLVAFLPYNDLDAVTRAVADKSQDLAAVVMEPSIHAAPAAGFLEGVREVTRRAGVALVFDEIVTGFRLARGGAMEAYGVMPDLACLGKGLANGMPLSALIGPEEHMRLLAGVGWGMTCQAETLSLAAAGACLDVLRNEPVAEHVARIGGLVRDGFEAACQRHDVRANLVGPPSRQTFVFQEQGSITPHDARSLMVQECLVRRVLTDGSLLPSYSHDDSSVEATVSVFDEALAVVARALDAGDVSGFLHMPRLFRYPD